MIRALGDILRNNAYKFPDDMAFRYVDRGLGVTFGDHLSRAERLAWALWQEGARPQDRIAILSKNTPEFLEAYAACEITGYIAATINWRFGPNEIEATIADCTPRVLLFEAPYAAVLEPLRDRLGTVRLFVCFGGETPDWAISYDDFIESGAARAAPATVNPDQLVHLIYTSGTTGRPKGVMRTQGAEVAVSNLIATEFGFLASERLQISMPIFHVGARHLQMGAHVRGAQVIVHREFRARDIVEAISREGVTASHMAPSLIQAILELPDIEDADLSSLRTICYGASPMPESVLRRGLRILGPIFLQVYGMTEGLATTLHKRQHIVGGTEIQQRRLMSVGQAAPSVDVRIADEDGEELPLGATGEILTRTPTLMAGYWNRSAETLAVLRDGWYRTGDIGTMDELGFVYLIDRKSDMIISGGENIYPREVEEAIRTHPAVADVAVAGIPDDYWGEAVCAAVVRRPGSSLDAAEVIEHCRVAIASYKKPRSVFFVDELPMLPSGKVSRVQLRKIIAAIRNSENQ